MTGRRARVRFLEEQAEVKRLTRSQRNRAKAERAESEMLQRDWHALERIRQAWLENREWVKEEFETAFADLPALPGEEEACKWYFSVMDAPLSATWPQPPSGTREYLAAELRRWNSIASQIELTDGQRASVEWHLATFKLAAGYARVL